MSAVSKMGNGKVERMGERVMEGSEDLQAVTNSGLTSGTTDRSLCREVKKEGKERDRSRNLGGQPAYLCCVYLEDNTLPKRAVINLVNSILLHHCRPERTTMKTSGSRSASLGCRM